MKKYKLLFVLFSYLLINCDSNTNTKKQVLINDNENATINCEHEYQKGECINCGKECPNEENQGCKNHNYVDDVCIDCGKQCGAGNHLNGCGQKNHNYVDGVCEDCGKQCGEGKHQHQGNGKGHHKG